MPKKLLGLIGLFILAAGLLVSLNLAGKKQDIRKKVSGSGSVLTIKQANINAVPGNQITVDVYIDTKEDTVSAGELHLTYDQTKLEGQSITAGTFLPEVLSKDLQGNPGGQIGGGNASIILGSGINAKKGSGILSTLTFKALNPSTSQINFTADTKVAAIGVTGNSIASMTGSQINVLAPTKALAPKFSP